MKRLVFSVGIIAALCSASFAREGKVFFDSKRWMKGDIQERKDDDGKDIVVITMKSGSMTVPRREVKNIIYTSRESPSEKRFLKALDRTEDKPITVRRGVLYDPYIAHSSSKHKLDPDLIRAVIKQESDFDRKSLSRTGARGLMQLMPETANGLGVKNSYDPWENIHGGTQYLKWMLEEFDGDLPLALAAYNAGPNAVKKYGGIPPYQETKGYVKNVLRYYRMYRGEKIFAFEDEKGRLVFTDQPFVK